MPSHNLPFALRSLAADLRPSAFTKYRRVAIGQQLPRPARRPRFLMTPLAQFPRRPGNERIWGVTMVRDESDIIAYTIGHLISQGVDRVLVADNCSTDGTAEMLADLSTNLPVTVVQDRELAYYQSWKMTRLARYAACSGAEWVLPFDADELWVAPGQTLRQFLSTTRLDVVTAPMKNHVPQASDDAEEPNPYRRLRYRVEQESRPVSKVAFRAHRLARVASGNHVVRRPGVIGDGLEIRHFPRRSTAQLRRKIDQGARALAATDHPQEIGSHWRLGAGQPDSQVEGMYGGNEPVVYDPAPYSGQL